MSDGGIAPYTFEALVDLAEGSNTVMIEATDGNGNVATQSYSVNAGGVQKTLEFDLNGNLRFEKDSLGAVLREFQWDAKNRLLALQDAAVGSEVNGTKRSEFEYDGHDRRIRIVEKTHDGSSWVTDADNVFIWDSAQIAQKRNSTGSTVERSYFSSGFEEGGNDYFYTRDHLGSIREVVASNGTTVEVAYDYSPWGEVAKISGTGVESDFLYTGHFYHVESNLHLALYRAYNPALGAWLSRDPIAENGGINLYAYGANSPINYTDPNGLWNLWNPLTWGLPTQPGENPWNPTDSSAEWAATGEGATKGAAAYADGFIPFSDPFKDKGVYNNCDKGTEYSSFLLPLKLRPTKMFALRS